MKITKPRILIRYTHRDRDFVKVLAPSLRKEGFEVFLYEKDLIRGDFIPPEFSSKEEVPTYLLYLLSGSTRWVIGDFERAKIKKKNWLNVTLIVKGDAVLLTPSCLDDYDPVGFKTDCNDTAAYQESFSKLLLHFKDAFDVINQHEFGFYLDNHIKLAEIEITLIRTYGEISGAMDSTQLSSNCSHYMTMKSLMEGDWLISLLRDLSNILPDKIKDSPRLLELNRMTRAAFQFIVMHYPNRDSYDNKHNADSLRFQLLEISNAIGKLRLLAEKRLISSKDVR